MCRDHVGVGGVLGTLSNLLRNDETLPVTTGEGERLRRFSFVVVDDGAAALPLLLRENG